MSRESRVSLVIHAASIAAGGVGAGLAQLPGSDSPILTAIQSSMILEIAREHGLEIERTAAVGLLLTFSATMGGRGVSQFMIGWLPGIGNAINATTAAAITEAVGWAAERYFSSVREPA